jgi:hypothetical protein
MVNMEFGQGQSRNNALFAPLYPPYPGDYYAADERQDEDNVEVDAPQQPQKRARLVRYPLSEWTKLGMPGMIKLMHQVQSLWWVPVLYDEECQDFRSFCTYAKINSASPKARSQHQAAVKALTEQRPHLGATKPHEQLLTAFNAMLDLESITVQPSRHANRALKPEALNIFALASVLTALGHARAADTLARLESNTRDRAKRRRKERKHLTTLRIFDIDLTAIIPLAPQGPTPIVANSATNDWLLPATLRDADELNTLAQGVFSNLTTLHWAFARAEGLEPRLGMERDETGESYEAQVRRMSSVLAACVNLRTLKLAFHPPDAHESETYTTTSATRSANTLSLSGLGLGDVSPFHQVAQPLPGLLGSAPQFIPAPVELDIELVLPFCRLGSPLNYDPLQHASNGSFRFLREFALSTVVLADSTALYNFITCHPMLEDIGFEDVGIRHGPTWSAILAHAKKSLLRLREVAAIRLMHVDHNTGYLVHESPQLYQLLWKALGSGIRLRIDL